MGSGFGFVLGRQAAWRAEVHSNWCRLVGGIVVAVALTGNCWVLGSGRGLNLVVWLFGDWCTIGLVDESSIS